MVDVIDFTKNMGLAMQKIRENGAFLTVKSGYKVNTMTIGWANFGFQWQRCVMNVLVKDTRYTFNLIENAESFTVTIPLDNSLEKEIDFCGSNSGRDCDKFKSCSLELKEGKNVDTPVINKKNVLTYECKIIYKAPFNPEFLDKEIDEKIYQGKNYHSLYVGEVMDIYSIKED